MGQIPKVIISDETMKLLSSGHRLMDRFKNEFGRIPTNDELTRYELQHMTVADLLYNIEKMKKTAARIKGNCFEKAWMKMASNELLRRKVSVTMAYKCLIKVRR